MPNDDKLTFLEQLSNALVGQTVTGGARALGEGIGYKYGGGDWSDIPDVMREALERHKVKTANQTKNEQDALAVASGLAAMSNPVSAIGHGVDFAAAVPEMLEYKLSDAEPPTGMIAETGLKRRLQKGGAAADYAKSNRMQRIDNKAMPFYETVRKQLELIPENQQVSLPKDSWNFAMRSFPDFPSGEAFTDFLQKNRLKVGLGKENELIFSKQPQQAAIIPFPKKPQFAHPLKPYETNPVGIRADVLESLYPEQLRQRPAEVQIDDYVLEKTTLPHAEHYYFKKKP